MSDPIRILIADDQVLLRGSLRLLLDSTPDLAVVGEAGTGLEVVAQVQLLHPDLVLMDVRMPDGDGVDATRRIVASPDNWQVRVLMLTTFDLDEHVYAALRAGASGFALKDMPPADLIAAIRTVARGKALLAPNMTKRLIAHLVNRPPQTRPSPKGLAGLTDRAREVLTHVAHGLSNSEIAGQLHVSTATVKTHIGHILAKLAVRGRVQLVIHASETRLVSPGR